MQEAWAWSLSQEYPLEKGMATLSSILAWRIPWTEETGGPQSMRLQRIGHAWATKYEHLRALLKKSVLQSLSGCFSSKLDDRTYFLLTKY